MAIPISKNIKSVVIPNSTSKVPETSTLKVILAPIKIEYRVPKSQYSPKKIKSCIALPI